MRFKKASALFIALAVVGVACGDDSKDSSGGTLQHLRRPKPVAPLHPRPPKPEAPQHPLLPEAR